MVKYGIAKMKWGNLDDSYLARNSLKFTAPGGCYFHAVLYMTPWESGKLSFRNGTGNSLLEMVTNCLELI